MAGILEKLSGEFRSRNIWTDLHLEFIRFRKFLENMRGVINLIEDARDKIREEYIFDRQYVLSLVDGVLEGMGMMAFNASVLSPATGKEIYLQLDRHRKFALQEFLESRNLRMECFTIPISCTDADPEMQSLHALLNWFSGPLPGGQPAVMDFIRKVTDEVLGNCRKESMIEKAHSFTGEMKLNEHDRLTLVDIGRVLSPKTEKSVSARDIRCRPFGLLFVGLLEGAASTVNHKAVSSSSRWMLFDEEEISLRMRRDNAKIHLEAALYGNVASDFIFLYFQNPYDLRSVLPQGSWVEKAGQGNLAWIHDVPTDYLEKQLVQLGSLLLG